MPVVGRRNRPAANHEPVADIGGGDDDMPVALPKLAGQRRFGRIGRQREATRSRCQQGRFGGGGALGLVGGQRLRILDQRLHGGKVIG